MQRFTPLRYPGGKGKLAPFIIEVIKHNKLYDITYIEPYAGGAAVALSLLLEGYAWDIIINDIDPYVYAFWWATLNNTEELSRLIHDAKINMDTWKFQKHIIRNQHDYSITDIAFATFFLNRTNRSGILQAGVIGGQNQNGKYKIDARFNKTDLLKRIALIASYKGRIHLYNHDAFYLINEIIPLINNKILLYLDPPYYNKGKLLYKNCYGPLDHIKIAELIKPLSSPWIVTYDNVPEIRNIYSGEKYAKFDISYSAHLSRPRGKEIMFYDNIALPKPPYTRKSS